jgi:hypothetical protein
MLGVSQSSALATPSSNAISNSGTVTEYYDSTFYDYAVVGTDIVEGTECIKVQIKAISIQEPATKMVDDGIFYFRRKDGLLVKRENSIESANLKFGGGGNSKSSVSLIIK